MLTKKAKKYIKKTFIFVIITETREFFFFFAGTKCINTLWFSLYTWNLKTGFLFTKAKNNKHIKLSTNLKRGKRFLYEVNNMDFEIHSLEIFTSIDTDTVHNANDVIGIIVTEYSLPVRLSEKTEWLNKMINEESPSLYLTHIFT